MRSLHIRLIAEIGLAVALSVALNAVFTAMLPISMPFGGSLSLNMLPIILLALMRGPVVGVTTGVLVGFSDLMFDPFILSLPQMLLDYPIAYGLVGLAGLFALKPSKKLEQALQKEAQAEIAPADPSLAKIITIAIIGTIVGGLARLAAHVLSGVIFFAQYAPELQNVWVYSILYNLSFMGPNIVVVALCAAVAFPVIRRAIVVSQTLAT